MIRGFETSRLAALSAARTVDCISLTQMVIEGCHCSSNVVRQCSAFTEQLPVTIHGVSPVEYVLPGRNYTVQFFQISQFASDWLFFDFGGWKSAAVMRKHGSVLKRFFFDFGGRKSSFIIHSCLCLSTGN